jgi:hypothetical protein
MSVEEKIPMWFALNSVKMESWLLYQPYICDKSEDTSH